MSILTNFPCQNQILWAFVRFLLSGVSICPVSNCPWILHTPVAVEQCVGSVHMDASQTLPLSRTCKSLQQLQKVNRPADGGEIAPRSWGKTRRIKATTVVRRQHPAWHIHWQGRLGRVRMDKLTETITYIKRPSIITNIVTRSGLLCAIINTLTYLLTHITYNKDN